MTSGPSGSLRHLGYLCPLEWLSFLEDLPIWKAKNKNKIKNTMKERPMFRLMASWRFKLSTGLCKLIHLGLRAVISPASWNLMSYWIWPTMNYGDHFLFTGPSINWNFFLLIFFCFLYFWIAYKYIMLVNVNPYVIMQAILAKSTCDIHASYSWYIIINTCELSVQSLWIVRSHLGQCQTNIHMIIN